MLFYRYGLILSEKKKQKLNAKSEGNLKPSIFASDSDSDCEPKKKVMQNVNICENRKRKIKKSQEQAEAEDPTIYQYDEVYDEMESKRKEDQKVTTVVERKPKYITKLMETADKRKKEQERRIERQVQKERAEEDEQFKDKESFVTSSYRKKLDEMQKAEEEEKHQEYLESIGDVTKQSDLGGFYRHIYSQKVGEDEKKVPTTTNENVADKDNGTSSKFQRHYRKKASDEEDDNDEDKSKDKEKLTKKAHLASNLDADSDFSIDSATSSSESSSDSSEEKQKDNDVIKTDHIMKSQKNTHVTNGNKKVYKNDENRDVDDQNNADDNINDGNDETGDSNTSDASDKSDDDDDSDKNGENNGKDENGDVADDETDEEKEVCKKKMWRKRTVADVYDMAVRRYNARKEKREPGGA